jgi:cell division initiation protein
VTNEEEQVYPYYRSPSSIRGEVFSHRMRGLDEEEVREYLDLLADQVQAADNERAEVRAENERLRVEMHRIKADLADRDANGEQANDQAVALFSQAQLVAEEMVEEVTRTTRERMMQARAQEREILQEALEAAEATRRQAEVELQHTMQQVQQQPSWDAPSWDHGRSAAPPPAAPPGSAAAELEHVRSFARIAQTQMQSIMDALAKQVDMLGHEPPAFEPPALPQPSFNGAPRPSSNGNGNGHHENGYDTNGSASASWRTWQIDVPGDRQDPWPSA